jgi:hypothetical protein
MQMKIIIWVIIAILIITTISAVFTSAIFTSGERTLTVTVISGNTWQVITWGAFSELSSLTVQVNSSFLHGNTYTWQFNNGILSVGNVADISSFGLDGVPVGTVFNVNVFVLFNYPIELVGYNFISFPNGTIYQAWADEDSNYCPPNYSATTLPYCEWIMLINSDGSLTTLGNEFTSYSGTNVFNK